MLCLICLVLYYHAFLFLLFIYLFSLSSVNFISCIFISLDLLFCIFISYSCIFISLSFIFIACVCLLFLYRFIYIKKIRLGIMK